jgi:prepilin-type N-terminal cleavage/methylation domain-containing protein
VKTPRGFTLIELMVSLVVFSFAIAGVLAVAVSMSQGFRDQRANVSAEGAARVPMDFIADAIRQASPGSPTGVILDTTAAACPTTAFNVINSSTAPDELDIIYASGAVVTSSQTAFTPGSSPQNVDVVSTTGLAVNDHIVISDTTQGHYYQISAISGQTLTLTGGCTSTVMPNASYGVGSLVIRAQHALFYIGTVDGVPTLMMNPTPTGTNATDIAAAGPGQPLAEGVEDLQIALGIDSTNTASYALVEGPSNTDDWLYNVAGEAYPVLSTGTIATTTLRAVRVTLIAITTSKYIGNTTSFVRPAAEDRAVGTTTDNFRRRVLRTIVEVRNIGESP